jgi:hypothetical protein
MSDVLRHFGHMLRCAPCAPLIIEHALTRDEKVDLDDSAWASIPVPPPGGRWVIFDSSRDRKTGWRRLNLVGSGDRA